MSENGKKRVVFFYYPFEVRYSHGLSLLKAILEPQGIDVRVVAIDDLTSAAEIAKEIRPDFFGFSFVTKHDYWHSIDVAKEAKATGIPVMCGGPYVTMGGYVDARLFDYVCRGEAEILGDFILGGDTTVFDKPYRQLCLDSLPMPDYSTVTGWEFTRNLPPLFGKRIMPYSSSRGCPHNCSFCAAPLQRKNLGGGVRVKSGWRKELEKLAAERGPDLIYFTDALLPYYDDEWCEELKGNRQPFTAYIRADIPVDRLDFLIDNGLSIAAFGVESGVEAYRNGVLGKGVTNEDIYRTVGKLRERGCEYIAFYIKDPPYAPKGHLVATKRLASTVGGCAQFYDYTDLGAMCFTPDMSKIEQYAPRVGKSVAMILDGLNDPGVALVNVGNGFYTYQVSRPAIFLDDLYGDTRNWLNRSMEDICKKHGVLVQTGVCSNIVSRAATTYYGYKEVGKVISKQFVR